MELNIAKTNSTRTDAFGQPAPDLHLRAAFLLAWTLFLLVLAGSGCSNLYHEAQNLYPADPCDRFQLRLNEAQQAEKRAEQAAATLESHLVTGLTGQAIEPDVDRLELTALDFSRRVASARDAAAACSYNASFETEVARLAGRAAEMETAAQNARRVAAQP